MDKFYEQLLTTTKSSSYKLVNALMYASGVFALLYFFFAVLELNFAYMIFAALTVGVFFALRYLRDKQYKEYEYIFTNGNLQIDIIYNQKKRKTIIDEDVKNFDTFSKADEAGIEKNMSKVVCIPWDYKGDVYVLGLSGKNKKAVYISPDEEMLKLIKLYAVRRMDI